MNSALFVQALGAFFAIMNPFIALPMFLAMTSSYDHARQRRTGLRVVLYSLVMSVVVMASGSAILGFFGAADGVGGVASIALALASVLAVLFVVLWFAPFIGRRMSETLRMIMTRLMGMIVAAIAVAMTIAGLQELIPILG